MAWTDEQTTLLVDYWKEGKSAAQIAILLGPGVSRNAVIGKVHRLGVGPHKTNSLATARPRRTRSYLPAAANAPRPASAPRLPRRPAVTNQERAEAFVTSLPGAPMALITELGKLICRWPIDSLSGEPLRYCALPVTRGAYCERHGALAYRGRNPRAPTPAATRQFLPGRLALAAWC